MIRNIFFDLDDTIFDFGLCEKNAFCETLERFGVLTANADLLARRYGEINLGQWKLLEIGKIKREEVRVNRFRIFFEEAGFDVAAEEAADFYEGELAKKHYFMPYAEETVKKISERYRVYIATNGYASVQHRRVLESGLEKYILGLFISEEIGYDKPSREYFERCFAMIPNFKREETVIVGDSLSSDILGGKNADIKTVWVNMRGGKSTDIADIEPDFTITDLRELSPVLKKM